jgi:hypothetical protein
MSGRILQLNFKFSVTGAAYTQAVAPLAEDMAAVPGLRWKIWMINKAEKEAGGIYMFEDQRAVDGFMESPLPKIVLEHPALSDFSIKLFDVMDAQTAITRGPIMTGAAA